MNTAQKPAERPADDPQQQATRQADEALRRARLLPRIATRRTMNTIRGI